MSDVSNSKYVGKWSAVSVGAFSNSGDLSIENVLSQELKNRGSINPLFFYFHNLRSSYEQYHKAE